MPIDTTSDTVHPLAAAREAIGDAKEQSRSGQTVIEKARRFSRGGARVAGSTAVAVAEQKTPAIAVADNDRARWIAVLAVCGYIGLTAMIYLTQRSLMYFRSGRM